MPNKRSRDRQLAKLAQRRAEERHRQHRKRLIVIAVVLGVVLVGGGVVAIAALTGGTPAARATATPKPTSTPSPVAFKKTGTVKPNVKPPKKVACGGSVPPAAGGPKPQWSTVPKNSIDPKKTYEATMVTSCGTITMKLAPKDAPIAVNNFVFLAQHHFYDGTWFHRIAKGFVIQGGDPAGDGSGGPGYRFTTETNPTTKFADASGLLAYANGGPDTNGSQFFVTLGKQPNLDPPNGPYTIFGKVTGGLAALNQIANVPTTASPSNPNEQSQPLQAVYVERVTISVSK